MIFTAVPFSVGIWYSASIYAKMRWTWRKYTRLKPYLELNNLPKLLMGEAIGSYLLDYTACRVFAYFLLFTLRLNKMCMQENEVGKAYQKFKGALLDTYKSHQPVLWVENKDFTFYVGRSRLTRWLNALALLQMRIVRIIQTALALTVQSLLLANRIIDLLEVFFANEKDREELIHSSLKAELLNVKEILIDLHTHRKTVQTHLNFFILQINGVLRWTGSSKMEDTIEGMENNFFYYLAKLDHLTKRRKENKVRGPIDEIPTVENYALDDLKQPERFLKTNSPQTILFKRENLFVNLYDTQTTSTSTYDVFL